MGVERKFIDANIRKLEVKEFLEKELEKAGCGEIDIQRTPLGTRVIVYAQRPGLIIGRKGTAIRKLTNILKKKYGMDNPQIEVSELDVPELNANIMAKNVASTIERGIHFRRAAYTTLRRIMEAGARGAEIRISGKLTGERAKAVKFKDGYIKHSGEPALVFVREGKAQAAPKPGIIGIKVRIMPPGVRLPDEIEFKDKGEGIEKLEIPTKGEIEKLVEGIIEEIGDVAQKIKKVKPEKIKRKKVKKVEEVTTEVEVKEPEPEETENLEEKATDVKKPESEEGVEKNYKSMSWTELRELAKKHGVAISGKGITREKIEGELLKIIKSKEENKVKEVKESGDNKEG